MKITTTVLEPKYEITSIICDKCKKEYSDPIELQEFLFIDFIAGYGSVYNDGDGIEADICQHCLRDWIKRSYRTRPFEFE